MSIKPVDLEKFIDTTKNIHEAIVVASRRARQINEDVKIEFNQRGLNWSPPRWSRRRRRKTRSIRTS